MPKGTDSTKEKADGIKTASRVLRHIIGVTDGSSAWDGPASTPAARGAAAAGTGANAQAKNPTKAERARHARIAGTSKWSNR